MAVLFTEALEKARSLDKELAAGVDTSKLGPFYGLPSSFKGESASSLVDRLDSVVS